MLNPKTDRRFRWPILLFIVRIGSVLLMLGLWIGLTLEWLPFPWLWLLLLLALLLPLLWPCQFGSWPGFLAALGAAALPALPVALGWANIDSSLLLYNALIIWLFCAWLTLPVALVLLLWRRWASPPVLLWALALTPVAVLLVLALGVPPDAALISRTKQVEVMVRMLPMWYVLLACTFAPLFFLVSLVWLVYREVTGATHPSTQ